VTSRLGAGKRLTLFYSVLLFPHEYRKRPVGEEDYFPRGIGRDLVERGIIFPRVYEETWWRGGLFSPEYRKRPGGEEDYFLPSIGRDLVERRIIFSRV
jgi:hypothetical protein